MQLPYSSGALLHDLARLLALAHLGKLPWPDPGRRSLPALLLVSGYLGPQATKEIEDRALPARASFIVQLALNGGLLRPAEEGLRLTPLAEDWLLSSADQQLALLQSTWSSNPSPTWSWLRGRSCDALVGSASFRRWRALIARAMEILAAGSHLCGASVKRLVAESLSSWPQALQGATLRLPSAREGLPRRAQSVLRFLFLEALPALGAAAIHSADDQAAQWPKAESAWLVQPIPDGLARLQELSDKRSTMLDEAGVEPLIVGPEAYDALPPEALLSVSDDLQIRVPVLAPVACTFDLTHLAELRSAGPPATYRITQESLGGALDSGYTPSSALQVLARYSDRPLPQPVRDWFMAQQEEQRALDWEEGYRLWFRHGRTLAALRERPAWKRLLQPGPSGRDAWVSRGQGPRVLRSLRRLGYRVRLAAGPSPGAEMWPAQRWGLPLVSLLAVLDVYHLLRQRLPGLADLDLEELQASWRQGASPLERAAVRQLRASHEAILNDALTQGLLSAEDPSAPGGARPSHSAEHSTPLRDGVSWGPGPVAMRLDLVLATLQTAIAEREAIELLYVNSHGRLSTRRICPLRLEERWGEQYLLASPMGHPSASPERRCFRIDRIMAIRRPPARAIAGGTSSPMPTG